MNDATKLNHLYNVGDEVFVKNLDDLIREFGQEDDGSIPTPSVFVHEMRMFCGCKVTIERVDSYLGVATYILKEDEDKWSFDECVLYQPVQEPDIDPDMFEYSFDSLF